jgi:hypothetical protein
LRAGTSSSCHDLSLYQTAVDAVSYIFSVKIDNHKAMFIRFSHELTGSPFPQGKGETFPGEPCKTERKNSPLLFQYRITIVHLSKNDKKILLAPAQKQKRPCPPSPRIAWETTGAPAPQQFLTSK